MYQNLIPDIPKLRNEDYANIFNVYTDEDNRYYYNLLQTVVIPDSLPANFYEYYSVTYEDTWPLISYKAYNTPNLWWLILTVNGIDNPIESLEPGKTIKYLKTEYASLIINQLTTQNL